jgi:hypothetical protein
VVPLEPATMPGRVVIQWDKDDCGRLGIIKIDLLGLRMMSVLQDAITLISEGGGRVDLAALPQDEAVYETLQRADTVGVFQVESRAQMATLPRIRPEKFYDLVVQVAIIRPGPIVGDMVHPYIRRRRGREPVSYPHPSLEPILRRTLGVPLFQEQLLRMAMVTAGFSGTEAEELRRAFGFKRSEARMAEVEGKLRAGMARQGIHGEAADQIAHAITAFALYGFPECVVGETRVIDAETGRWVRIEDVASGQAALPSTLACDQDLRYQQRRVLRATSSGSRMAYRVHTALGRRLMATAEHPLLTPTGWRALATIRPGDHLAAPRSLPAFGRRRWPRHRLIALADLIAEGNLCVLPEDVFELDAESLAVLVTRLIARREAVTCDTFSRAVAEGLQHLLLRLGVVSRICDHISETMCRWVVERIDREQAAASHVYWDRVVSVEPVGIYPTYDLEIEGDHNFLANDLVVHNSHASSFALLAYASAYLKVHHGAAFYAALLNNQPMGFYHAATIVKDAQRHGQRVLDVDVTRSPWPCTIEDGAVRLGLNYVKGLRERAGRAIVAARTERSFTSVADVARRAGLDRDELATLAAIGAFDALGGTRRANLWTAARPLSGELFAPAPEALEASPLRDMDAHERLRADYAGTGVTLGPHPMVLRRPALTRLPGRPVLRATDLPRGRDGSRVRVAGNVIVRQRPGTAKGFVFLSLEDETGIANVIVTPGLFARNRLVLVSEPFLLVEGILQIQDGVVSVRADRILTLPRRHDHVPSHDFG